MCRVVEAIGQTTGDEWQEVQAGRFSYSLSNRRDTNLVRMIVRDYLAVEVQLYGAD